MSREEWLLSEAIEDELREAHEALSEVDRLERSGDMSMIDNPEDDRYEIATLTLSYHIDRALRAIGALAERLHVPSIEREVSKLRSKPARIAETTRPFDGDIHSEALQIAYNCFHPLRAMSDAKAVTAHAVLRNILDNSAVILRQAGVSPKNETEVRNAVLEVCRYSFPDAIKEVGIPQIIKTSKADIGVQSLRTVIEFKFVDTKQEMATALDGVYADMKGYTHPDWDTFYGVFYMTGPFYVQEDVRRQFEIVRADARWSPVVVQGGGARVSKTKIKPAGS
jgi:hypothetical protein